MSCQNCLLMDKRYNIQLIGIKFHKVFHKNVSNVSRTGKLNIKKKNVNDAKFKSISRKKT